MGTFCWKLAENFANCSPMTMDHFNQLPSTWNIEMWLWGGRQSWCFIMGGNALWAVKQPFQGYHNWTIIKSNDKINNKYFVIYLVDVFIPMPENLLVNLNESKEVRGILYVVSISKSIFYAIDFEILFCLFHVIKSETYFGLRNKITSVKMFNT